MPPPPFTAAPAGRVIEAPVMGVFYRSPAPGEPPFVDVGDTVESGQPVGMIEAMKVFSEVLCEVTGRVIDIPAKNGALVQPGERLVVVEEQA
jgi:acetyl-CoA carboxylase biotin carboxyl carrier protein